MKRTCTYLALMLALLAFVGCGKKQSVEFWTAYDPVDSYAFPSDTSTVVQQLNSSGTIVEVVERDSTGKWGCYVVSKKLFKGKKVAWVPLDQLVYGGSDNPEEKLETFVVMPETLEMYFHPKGDKKDMMEVQLSKDDTVQATARSYSWVHVRKINYSKTGHHADIYGWVKETQLQQIDTLNYKTLDDLAAAKAVKGDAAKMAEKYSNRMATVHPWYRKACIWLGWVALGLIVVFLVPAFNRSKFWNLIFMLPISVLLTYVGKEWIMPTWLMALVIPFMVYVLCYPLLYFRTSRSFGLIYELLTIGVTGFYFFLYLNLPNHSGFALVLRILLLLAIVFGVFMIAAVFSQRIEKDICPHCGYFAKHSKGPRRVKNSIVSHGSGTERVYDGRTTETRGNTQYITEQYHDEVYQTETTTTHYEIDRKCMRCRQPFFNRSSSTSTRRV